MGYNYEHFDAHVDAGEDEVEFGGFPGHLHVGGAAPDVTLTRLDDGRLIRLSDRWRTRTVVMEFGSFT